MNLSKSQLRKLKEELYPFYGQKWAKEIANLSNCTPIMVRKVFNKSKPDHKEIVKNALKLLSDAKEKYTQDIEKPYQELVEKKAS